MAEDRGVYGDFWRIWIYCGVQYISVINVIDNYGSERHYGTDQTGSNHYSSNYRSFHKADTSTYINKNSKQAFANRGFCDHRQSYCHS